MRLWRLRTERFRGIASLDWKVTSRVSCLVGAGDMAKTTILDAISLLGTTRNPTFTDDDFHGGTTVNGSILIEGVFGDLPPGLLPENRFGLDLVGIDEGGNVHDEPGRYDPGLVIRLDVDHTLQPVWRVVSARNPDGRPLTNRDRATLGINRLGDAPDRQFSLGRGTALARAAARSEDVSAVLSDAYRQARAAVRDTDLSVLDEGVGRVAEMAATVGAGAVAEELGIRLEISPTTAGGLTLHAADIPVRSAGLGTRRLLALGLELENADAGGVVCIDEIEHGLEPHRIRHLVNMLSSLVQPDGNQVGGHVIFTSHSSVVLSELGTNGLSVVRNSNGSVDVRSVPIALTPLVRANPEALLARKAVVGEGKTEVGITRIYGVQWASAPNGQPLAHRGVAVVEGGGHTAAQRAFDLATLGYPTLLLADSDRMLNPSTKDLVAAGVTVVQWEGEMCTEQRVFTDISWEGLRQVFQAVIESGIDARSVVDAILGSAAGKSAMERHRLKRTDVGDDLDALVAVGLTQDSVRVAFAAAAANKDWFKRIDSGERLGAITIADDDIPRSPFGQAIASVETWAHG